HRAHGLRVHGPGAPCAQRDGPALRVERRPRGRRLQRPDPRRPDPPRPAGDPVSSRAGLRPAAAEPPPLRGGRRAPPGPVHQGSRLGPGGARLRVTVKGTLRPAASILLLLTLGTGILYPAVVTAIAQLLFPWRANGSLLAEGGAVVGSEWIGQPFSD